MRLTHVCLAVLFHKLYAEQLFKFFFLLFINEKKRKFTSATQNWALFRHLFLTGSRSLSLSIQFPTTVFVYIHRNQSSNHSTGNKGPIGKNKGPGSENVHSSEFEILALYIYIIVYNITRGYSVVKTHILHITPTICFMPCNLQGARNELWLLWKEGWFICWRELNCLELDRGVMEW